VRSLPDRVTKMSSPDRTRDRVALRVLVATSDEIETAATPVRDRAILRRDRLAWSRMSALERVLAAEREDPSFDYAAN
jgi:hypothetical protein